MIQVSSSMIRKITRGTSTANGDVTISCSITDTSKVIVLLDADCVSNEYLGTDYGVAVSGGGVYLKSISTSKIVVFGRAQRVTRTGISDIGISFSYQIIEFM